MSSCRFLWLSFFPSSFAPFLYFFKSKSSRPCKGTRAIASCFHPISCTCRQMHLRRFYQTLTLYREFPEGPTIISARQTQKCTSASYPYPLSLSGLALLSSDAYSFLHRFVVCTLPRFEMRVNKIFVKFSFPNCNNKLNTRRTFMQ